MRLVTKVEMNPRQEASPIRQKASPIAYATLVFEEQSDGREPLQIASFYVFNVPGEPELWVAPYLPADVILSGSFAKRIEELIVAECRVQAKRIAHA